MEENENQIFSKINRTQKNLINLSNKRLNIYSISKYNYSRNSFTKNIKQISSNFCIFKNILISNNISQDIPTKNEELISSDINSASNKKTKLVNSVQFDESYLRKISYKTSGMNNNINILRNKKRKYDFIKYKFLLGQKNYFKRLFQNFDFGLSLYDSKSVNPSLKKDLKKYNDESGTKKIYLKQDDINIPSTKDGSEDISINSCKNANNNQNNNKIIFKRNNYTNIKIKKYILPNIIKQQNDFLLENDKNTNKSNNLFEKCKEYKKQEKIIYDNYNEYLKGISSSESNESLTEVKRKIKKNNTPRINNLKPLIKKLSLYNKEDIYHNIKRINKNRNSSIILGNSNNFEFDKFIINRRKALLNIGKNDVIKNPVIRKRIVLKKVVL